MELMSDDTTSKLSAHFQPTQNLYLVQFTNIHPNYVTVSNRVFLWVDELEGLVAH